MKTEIDQGHDDSDAAEEFADAPEFLECHAAPPNSWLNSLVCPVCWHNAPGLGGGRGQVVEIAGS